MRQKYLKFASVEEAINWGKEHFGYWLTEYQLGGKLRGIYDIDHLEKILGGKFSEEELQKVRRDLLLRCSNRIRH